MDPLNQVAEEFGTGRGTLFDILELLFGKDYVVPCTFGELTGAAGRVGLQRGVRAQRTGKSPYLYRLYYSYIFLY
jgi:hypothetical protein